MQFQADDAFSAGWASRRSTPRRSLAILRRGLWMLLALGALATQAQAQWATVRGRVIDQADEQPLADASLLLRNQDDGSRLGTSTDGNGYFILARIPPGRYVLLTSFVGYVTAQDTLELSFNDRRTLTLRLHAKEAELDEVVVESEREAGTQRGSAGFAAIRPSALARIPTPGPSADLAGYLQTLPGVVTTGDRGGQLFIRGGTPTQNLVMLDGMPIFQPFHIVGFYSAFPADIIAYTDVYTGGFGARYGGRLSSVIDVATRNGNKRRLGGAVSMAPFLSAARLEIPLMPERVSVLASVRESVIERVAPDVLGQDLPYRFGDRFVKFHAFLNRTSSLALTALSTFDEGDVADTEGRPNELRWRNEAYGGHYTYLPEDYAALTRLSFFYSRLESSYRPFGARKRTTSAKTFGLEVQFIYYLRNAEVQAGVFARNYGFDFDLGARRARRREFLSEGGLYIDARFHLTPQIDLDPGLRIHSFPHRSGFSIEPRLRAQWRPDEAHVFSAAGGVYRQEIVGLYNARDITDAFVAWAPSPENQAVPRALHALAAWKGRLQPWLTLGVEVYFKALSSLAFAQYTETLPEGVLIEKVAGQAKGLDLTVEVVQSSWYGSVGYGLAQVYYEREDAPGVVERFAPPHDRRHQVNALIRFSRGPYALSARWQLGSGRPFTQAAGFYNAVPVGEPGADDFRTRPGTPVLVTADQLYAARTPAYHRMDVSLERRFESRWMTATVQASVINVYDRANLFDYDLFAARRVNQLPLIPSLGLKIALR